MVLELVNEWVIIVFDLVNEWMIIVLELVKEWMIISMFIYNREAYIVSEYKY